MLRKLCERARSEFRNRVQESTWISALALVLAAIALSVVATLHAGCSMSEQPERSSVNDESPSTCPEPHGPPTREVMQCRLVLNSSAGRYDHKLSALEIEEVLDAIDDYLDAVAAKNASTVTDDQFLQAISQSNRRCFEHTGSSCESVLIGPVSR